MKRIIAAIAVGALPLGLFTATAGAAPKGKAHGKSIQTACGGLTFGELRALHPDSTSLDRGAKRFATSAAALEAVCLPDEPDDDPLPPDYGF